MAEDYLTDDEQWEAVKRWLVENGAWLVAGVVLGAALLFGYRYYESSRNERALRAAARFGEMTSVLEGADHAKARRIADGLIQEFPSSPYADQAQLALARLAVDDGRAGDAVAPLTQVMNSSKDSELKHIARLRLARVSIDLGKPDDAIKLLTEDPAGAFAVQYHEVHGDALYAKKDLKGATTEYKAALAAADAGSVDTALLELKIADLGVAPAPLAAAAVPMPLPAADTSNKATP